MIQLARREDLEEVLAVINTTNRLFYKRIVPPERFKDPFVTEGELREEFKDKDFYVYELAGRVVGVAALEVRALGAYEVGIVSRMYVFPECQRKGIGTALIQEIEQRVGRRGIREILIWTDPKASWAITFYKNLGYLEIGPDAHYGDEP